MGIDLSTLGTIAKWGGSALAMKWLTPRIYNTLKAAGPWVLAHFPGASEEELDRLKGLAALDVTKDLMKQEAKMYSDNRKKLIDKYMKAPDEERIRIHQDLEFIDAQLQKNRVVNLSLPE